MPDFPASVSLRNQINIGTSSQESLIALMSALATTFNASTAWPTSNLAMFFPVEVYQPITIVKMMVNNGTAVSGNIDVGIYDASGNKRVSAGSTAQAGTSAIQIFDITDTLLFPGLYYMAVALDNTTGTLSGWSTPNAIDLAPAGIFQQASAFALPSPATFAVTAQVFIPLISMTPKVTI